MNGVWSRVTIAGKPADVYDPPSRPRFGIIDLHDDTLETLRDRPACTRLFEELRLACVCPHGGRCWWVDRVCRDFDAVVTPEQFVLTQVVPFLRERWQLAPRSLAIQGIGMGGQAALRIAFRHPRLFPVVAAIAPALDYHELHGQGTVLDELYDSKEQCRQDTALMHVPPAGYPPHIFFGVDPDDVQWYRGNDRLHEKLSALGIPHQFDCTPHGGGHSWEYFEHMAERAERFIEAGLVHESRRLL